MSTSVRSAVLTSILGLSVASLALGQTTVDFDSLVAPAVITTEYAGDGVALFVSGDGPDGPMVFSTSLAGQSAPNVMVSEDDVFQDSITFDFVVPVPFVSIQGLDVGANGLTLECFDGAGGGGSSLGIDTAPGAPGDGIGAIDSLEVIAAGIASCVVAQIDSTTYPTDGYAIDDLTFPVELQSFSVE